MDDNYQPHIKCKKGSVAKVVLLPGDPGRIDRIVKYWDSCKEVSFNREFRTVTGTYRGIRISSTSTGIGCPSAAIAVEELANIGAEVFIRVGTCGSLKENIKAGDIIIPYAAIRAEGTTREYIEPEFPAVADFGVVSVLEVSARQLNAQYYLGVDRCHDAFYEPVENMLRWGGLYRDKRTKNWNIPLVSSEMECSAIFLISMLRGLKAGAVLSVVTPEPLSEIVDNPSLVYELVETKDTSDSIDLAIKIALEAAVSLQTTD